MKTRAGLCDVLMALTVMSSFAVAKGEAVYPKDDVRAGGLCDGRIAKTTAGVDVQVHPDRPWSGVSFLLPKDLDLTALGDLVVVASNATDRPLRLRVHAKTKGFPNDSLVGTAELAARAVERIRVPCIAKSHALGIRLSGMRGYDDGVKSGKGLDPRRIGMIDVFRPQSPDPAAFRVLSISTEGEGFPFVTPNVPDPFFPFVDRFGQFKHGEWPGKVHSEEELRACQVREAAELAKGASPIAGADRFGGWATGPQLKSTGFFRVEKRDGKWWFVDPEGHLFFSQGIDCVWYGADTGIGKRERFFEWIPEKDDRRFDACRGKVTWPAAHGFYSSPSNLPYATFDFARANLIRLYGDKWLPISRDLAHRRFACWGVNTIGNWSDPEACRMGRTPYVATVHTGSFKKKLPRSKGWWGPLPDVFAEDYPAFVRRQVRATAQWMKADPWCVGVFVDNELSWNEEPETLAAAERYFTVVSQAMKEELPNHLYLGCRFMSSAGAGMYRIAAKHCDVVSVNVYAHLPRVQYPADAQDRPVIVGEFHFGALDRGMFHTGLVPVADQKARAAAYARYVGAALEDPRLVGVHWFQYRDQAFTGRNDSECYQIGFVNVADAPYPEMVEAAREIARTMYVRRSSAKDVQKEGK